MMTTKERPDLSSLDDDGATLELEDGRTLRLRVEADEGTEIGDSDCYGRVGFDELDRDTGQRRRPEGFDGNAERLWYGNDGPWWWQPPADVKRSDPGFSGLRETVCELLAFGFKVVGLEVLEGEDHYGRPIVTGAAWLGGIDTLDTPAWTDAEGVDHPWVMNGYLAEVVSELASELGVSY